MTKHLPRLSAALLQLLYAIHTARLRTYSLGINNPMLQEFSLVRPTSNRINATFSLLFIFLIMSIVFLNKHAQQ